MSWRCVLLGHSPLRLSRPTVTLEYIDALGERLFDVWPCRHCNSLCWEAPLPRAVPQQEGGTPQ